MQLVYDSPAKKRANKNLRQILGFLLSDWFEFLIHIHVIFSMSASNQTGPGCAKICCPCEGQFVLLKKEHAYVGRSTWQDWSLPDQTQRWAFRLKTIAKILFQSTSVPAKRSYRTSALSTRLERILI